MTFFFFLIGASIASFSQVWIIDTHSGHLSLTRRSTCATCKTPLKPWHLFPVLSFLFLRGRCAFCHKKISIMNFLYECIFGVVFSFSYIQQKPFIWFIWLAIALFLSLEDYYYQEIFLFPTILLHLFLFLVVFTMAYPLYPSSFFYGLLLFFLFTLFFKDKMGSGDWLVLLFWSPLLPFSDLLKLFMYGTLLALPFAFLKREPLPFLPFLTMALLFLAFF